MTCTKDNIVFAPKPTNRRFHDLTNQKFNRLTVLGYDGCRDKRSYWWAECDCGTVLKVRSDHLRKGATQSCGCYNHEVREARKITHGKTDTPEHSIWEGMKWRCLNQNNPSYPEYGGRGIAICDRWLKGENGTHPFLCFLQDMGERPSSRHSVERKDVNGSYEPSNCYWATPTEQANNKRNNIRLTYKGKTQTLQQWCDELQIHRMRTYFRLQRGWSVAAAFETPSRRLLQ